MFQRHLKKVVHIPTMHPYIKAFIITDSLIYSSQNLVTSLFAVFVTMDVLKGNIEVAAGIMSSHFISRIITELVSGKYISKLSEQKKLSLVLMGMGWVTLSYLGFAVSRQIWLLYLFWIISGIGWGIAFPTKLSIFSKYMDEGEGVSQWGLTDAVNLSFIATTTVIGGYIAHNFGFTLLFILAAVINLLSLIPFLIYRKKFSN